MLEIVNEYASYLLYQKNYSKDTIDSYTRDINKFLEFMNNENYTLNSVDSTLIRNFLAHETLDGISKRSNARRVIALRQFYEYLVKNNYVEFNPFIVISTPKVDKKLPEFMYLEEINNLFELNSQRKDFLMHRDQAIIELLFSSGLRVSELVNLTLQDLNLKENEILKSKLIGFDVIIDNENIGKITEIFWAKANDVIRVNENILIPYVDEFIEKLDKENKKIYVKNVRGLL